MFQEAPWPRPTVYVTIPKILFAEHAASSILHTDNKFVCNARPHAIIQRVQAQ